MVKSTEEKILAVIKAKKAAKIGDFVIATGFSRVYLNKVLGKLIKEKKIIRVGATNKVRYLEFDANRPFISFVDGINVWHKRLINNNLHEDLVFKEFKDKSNLLMGLSTNVVSILEYTFTEMLNNAIEHSHSKQIDIRVVREDRLISFAVEDRGVGVFNSLINKRHLKSELEAVQDLLKGKQTTAPSLHSGEGIFFTSKIADKYTLIGGKMELFIDNILPDIFIKQHRQTKGTFVFFTINVLSKKKLSDIFNKFSEKNGGAFNATEIKVHLFTIDSDFVSRSQARRLLAGLEKFSRIILDFDRVQSIGQGFADEIFRVFKHTHSDKTIEAINTNPEVDFMIKRAKAA